MKKLQIGSLIVKLLPLLALIAFFALQNYYADQILELYLDSAKQKNEILSDQMSRENVSPELGRLFLQISSNNTSDTERLVSSLTRMQIFYQLNILLIFWMVYSLLSGNKTKKEDNQSS